LKTAIVLSSILATANAQLFCPNPVGNKKSDGIYVQVGKELVEPPVYRSDNGVLEVDLEFDITPYDDPWFTCPMGVRTYNGISPGPTIIVQGGDTLIITLHNALAYQEHEEARENLFRDANVTNLHTHGLHISANQPQDDVLLTIFGGYGSPPVLGFSSYRYVYQIPDDHMGGHTWYHPHNHGSSSLQTAFAHGSIIVENKNYGFVQPLPRELRQMRTKLITLSAPQFIWVEAANGYTFPYEQLNSVFEEANEPQCVLKNPDCNPYYVRVNGHVYPETTINMKENVVFRTLNGDWNAMHGLTVPGCRLYLLAKDGIPIADAPRLIEYVYLPSGTRADWILNCPNTGKYKMMDETAGIAIMEINVKKMTKNNVGPGLPPGYSTHKKLMSLPKLKVRLPNYLRDLVNAPVDTYTHIKYEAAYGSNTFMNGMTAADYGPNSHDPLNYQGSAPQLTNYTGFVYMVNQYQWEWPSPVAQNVTFNDVVQTTLQEPQPHPHHQHVNPFQLVSIPGDGYMRTYGSWFKVGDWHDVYENENIIIGYDPVLGGQGLGDSIIRWVAADFPDEVMIYHCHILWHEDHGMMSYFRIVPS